MDNPIFLYHYYPLYDIYKLEDTKNRLKDILCDEKVKEKQPYRSLEYLNLLIAEKKITNKSL